MQNVKARPAVNDDMRTHTFVREEGGWYIHLPNHQEQGISKRELYMSKGTGALLETVAQGKDKVTLMMDVAPFAGADLLELVRLCDSPKGGGYYFMHTCRGIALLKKMWLCDVLLFVFGDIPEKVYVKRMPLRER